MFSYLGDRAVTLALVFAVVVLICLGYEGEAAMIFLCLVPQYIITYTVEIAKQDRLFKSNQEYNKRVEAKNANL